MTAEEQAGLAMFMAHAVFCIIGLLYVVSAIFDSSKHRHSLDPVDLHRIDADSVQWTCWDCGECLTAECGLDIYAGNHVIQRPDRAGDLWGDIRGDND